MRFRAAIVYSKPADECDERGCRLFTVDYNSMILLFSHEMRIKSGKSSSAIGIADVCVSALTKDRPKKLRNNGPDLTRFIGVFRSWFCDSKADLPLQIFGMEGEDTKR